MNVIRVYRDNINHGIVYIDEISRINVDDGHIAIVCKNNGVKIGNKIVFENNDELNRCGYNGIQLDNDTLRMDIVAGILAMYENFIVIDKHYDIYTSYSLKMVKIKQVKTDYGFVDM